MSGIIGEVLRKRAEVASIILIAAFLSLGINLIANVLDKVRYGIVFYLLIGLALITIPLCYVIAPLLKMRKQKRQYKGFVIYRKKTNRLYPVSMYHFSEEMCKYLDAAFLENKWLLKAWENDPLSEAMECVFEEDENEEEQEIKAKEMEKKGKRSSQIICEAAEFFVLNKLCVLSSYLDREEFDKKKIKSFVGKRIPIGLLENRFMRLFFKPIEKRSVFKDEFPDQRNFDNVYSATADNGAIFERFQLMLPLGSSVRRLKRNVIEIKTDRFTLSIETKTGAYCTILPRYFEDYYLGLNDHNDRSEIEVEVNIEVVFNISTVISFKGWKYYQWIDEFLEDLKNELSKDAFLKTINWEHVLAVIQGLSHFNRKA